MDDFGENGCNRTVHLHGSAAYSPNNFVFQIAKDGASVWFIPEFDPKDPESANGVKFPESVGKRKIAIHWTFLKDNDGSKYGDAVAKRKVSDKKLPCQFSPNEDERSMKAVNEYLELKKEEKIKKEEEREEEAKRKLEHLLAASLSEVNKVFKVSEGLALGFSVEEIFETARDLSVRRAEVPVLSTDGLIGNDASLLEAVKAFTKNGNEKLNEAFSEEFFKREGLWEAFRRDVNEAFVRAGEGLFVHLDKINKRIFIDSVEEREKKEVKEDEEAKKRWLLFKLKQMLKKVAKNSTIAAKDVVLYLDELGLQKVLETVFNADYSNDVNVEISFDPYLKDRKDEWVEAFRKICSGSSALGRNEVRIVGGDKQDVNSLRYSIMWSVNACASVQRFLGGERANLSLYSLGDSKAERDNRKKEADRIAARFKEDYPNQIPLAILTALGEFGRKDPKKLSKKNIDKAVKRLNKKILEKKLSGTESDVGVFENDNVWGYGCHKVRGGGVEVFHRIDADYGSGLKPTFYPSYGGEINDKTFYDAKKVFPKSLAKRMLWIKRTTEKKEGAEDKVIYAVDFDTAEGFDEDVPLAFENGDKKGGQLNVTQNTLEYLRYSLDPEAFLEAFFEVPSGNGGRMASLSRKAVTPAFFDALQAMCDKDRDSEHLIDISDLDTNMVEKSLLSRFDPRAETYVVFENKRAFRYANKDELARFKEFKDENPLDKNSDFEAIEEAKRKWFESEAKRVKEEAEEAERKKKEKEENEEKGKRQALVDEFNAGGEIEVDKNMINALGEEGVILLSGASYSVLDVIRKAAEAGSNVTKLNVTFDNLKQFYDALNIIIVAAREGKNANLGLRVQEIKNFFEDLPSEDKERIETRVKELDEADRLKGVTVIHDKLKIWLSGFKGGGRDMPLSVEDKVVCVDKKKLLEEEEERLRKEQEEKEKAKKEEEEEEERKMAEERQREEGEIENNALNKAWESGRLLDIMDAGFDYKSAFALAGNEAKEFDARGVSAKNLADALKEWFEVAEHRNNVPNWFLTLDNRDTAVWKAMEKVAEEINRRNGDLGNGIFMHLDKEDGKILFQRTVDTNIPPLSLAPGGKELDWKFYRSKNEQLLIYLCNNLLSDDEKQCVRNLFRTIDTLYTFQGKGRSRFLGKTDFYDTDAMKATLLHCLCHPSIEILAGNPSRDQVNTWLTQLRGL